MTDHITNRNKIIDFLRSELVGPCLFGGELETEGEITFPDSASAFSPWIQKETGEEIIQGENPTTRYGIGVLYPIGIHSEVEDSEPADPGEEDQDRKVPSVKIEKLGSGKELESDSCDFDLSTANSLKPSSMGISFLVSLGGQSGLKIRVTGGRYIPRKIKYGERETIWWFREPVSIEYTLEAKNLLTKRVYQEKIYENKDLKLNLECYSRPDPVSNGSGDKNTRLVTLCLVNRTQKDSFNEYSLFQSRFTVIPDHGAEILPYPEKTLSLSTEHLKIDRYEKHELESLKLLYRNLKTFAVGHGCSACWNDRPHTDGKSLEIRAECLPEYEIPSITPDITRLDGSVLKVSMASLASLNEDQNNWSILNDFIDEYSKWIDVKENEADQLDPDLSGPAARHIKNARECLERMKNGIRFLKENPQALEAFILANRAILIQQILSAGGDKRAISWDNSSRRKIFIPDFDHSTDFTKVPEDRGTWRAFQIAFILMNLESSVTSDDERDTVELIWFPTGGGKTEAYLGLASYVVFYRRLLDSNDTGVNVLMRYTLRLLTAQQFQRASRLICAMEYLRKKRDDLGEAPISIGIWIGSGNTPNTRQDALNCYRSLVKDKYAENKFVLGQCPWCGAEMGPYMQGRKRTIAGYDNKGRTVSLKCPDRKCSFSQGLPVYVIDEDIYEFRPSLIIGTVDKFAQLAWKPESASLFGIDSSGERTSPPPSLIIQDELHLISGPLGTMVGLYETVIENFCTDQKEDKLIRPKIVCSTATIRRFNDQIRNLFGREKAFLFPPPELEEGNSFFARYAKDENKKLLPGRRYLGIFAPGHMSLQTTQVRTFSSLLMAAMSFDKHEARDPWWSLMIFYNSLRELGGALSLFQSDIPGAIKGVAGRHGIKNLRYLNKVFELTGRLRNDEVPKALDTLSIECAEKSYPVDVCLASSILEVGIDIDRLSLMGVVGQPKTTSQYIQVTGRVGRKWWERPGLICTLYSCSKPRDRSHFEKFQTYHGKIYAGVEPTSVTPFAPPVVDRALHSLIAIYLRLKGSNEASGNPTETDNALLDQLRELITARVNSVDDKELTNTMSVFEKRCRQLSRWEKRYWDKYNAPEDSLLRRYETWVTEEVKLTSWATPTSMRNVDAECQMDITRMYSISEED